jgi:hypothetical protein
MKDNDMRTKVIIDGFKNSQKLRVIINGITVYTTIKGVLFDLFGNTEQRAAVCDALLELSYFYRTEKSTGLGKNFRGYSIQVNLI